ncbi:MAG: hypothetical protein H6703_14485 [Myxococcales bacterium]|nr:hypothetical protein [Myxococcales bacterium]
MRRETHTALAALMAALTLFGCVDDDPADPGADAATACADGETRACAVGACTGTARCADGVFGECAVVGEDERCDGEDNDCDGMTDEGFAGLGDPCEAGADACRVTGTITCAADGSSAACDAIAGDGTAEICDGVDNDCDGVIDDGVGGGAPCETGEAGVCAAGLTRCADGAPRCDPITAASAEVCDGLDNDCDGAADEGEDGAALVEPCYSGPEGTAGVGACTAGSRRCVDGMPGACMAQLTPIEEICDGIDSDCDGTTDEGFGLGEPCAVGVGACAAAGVQVCDGASGDATCDAVAGAPGDELCNAIDDDCDGLVDEVEGAGDACEAGEGACRVAGLLTCTAAGLACDAIAGEPADEACNAIDDDCDGAVDELPGVGEACAAGVGACRVDGARVCDPAAGALVCDARAAPPGPIERCGDGVDDDCDGETDEAACSTPCADDADCPGAICVAGLCGVPEVCDDGDDDDADGAIDCLDPDCAGDPVCGPCGNNALDPDEGCDDGDRLAGDGCAPDCTVEAGFRCAPPGIDACAAGQPADALTLVAGETAPPLGGNGGNAFADPCPAGEVVIGFDLHIGDEWRFSGGAINVQRIRAQCARLDRVGDAFALTPTGVTPDRAGVPDSGVPAGYNTPLRCPAGQVVTGASAYGGEYVSGLAHACSTLALVDGALVVGPPVEQDAVGRLDARIGDTACPAGTVAGAFVGRGGHILDQLTLRCDRIVDACRVGSTCELDRACRFGFESGAIEAPFATDGAQPWRVVDGAATSGAIGDNQQSNLRIPVSTPAGGRISFQRRVSSEGCCDYLRLRVDGAELGAWRGDVPWGEVSFELAPGDHVIEWAYTKDISLADGEDRAQIDDVAIEGAVGLCAAPP